LVNGEGGDKNLKATQIQGPMIRSRTKQSEDTLQQMVAVILEKVKVEKDEDPEALPIILIVEDPN